MNYSKSERIKYWIIKYFMENKITITRSKVETFYLYYRQHTKLENNQYSAYQFFSYIYN